MRRLALASFAALAVLLHLSAASRLRRNSTTESWHASVPVLSSFLQKASHVSQAFQGVTAEVISYLSNFLQVSAASMRNGACQSGHNCGQGEGGMTDNPFAKQRLKREDPSRKFGLHYGEAVYFLEEAGLLRDPNKASSESDYLTNDSSGIYSTESDYSTSAANTTAPDLLYVQSDSAEYVKILKLCKSSTKHFKGVFAFPPPNKPGKWVYLGHWLPERKVQGAMKRLKKQFPVEKESTLVMESWRPLDRGFSLFSQLVKPDDEATVRLELAGPVSQDELNKLRDGKLPIFTITNTLTFYQLNFYGTNGNHSHASAVLSAWPKFTKLDHAIFL